MVHLVARRTSSETPPSLRFPWQQPIARPAPVTRTRYLVTGPRTRQGAATTKCCTEGVPPPLTCTTPWVKATLQDKATPSPHTPPAPPSPLPNRVQLHRRAPHPRCTRPVLLATPGPPSPVPCCTSLAAGKAGGPPRTTTRSSSCPLT